MCLKERCSLQNNHLVGVFPVHFGTRLLEPSSENEFGGFMRKEALMLYATNSKWKTGLY